LTIEKNRAISTSQTFSGDDVSLMLGDNLTVNDGVSLTIEDDAQFIIVPSTFFIQ
jgi:dTDP-glucose pyrophosphorylase